MIPLGCWRHNQNLASASAKEDLKAPALRSTKPVELLKQEISWLIGR